MFALEDGDTINFYGLFKADVINVGEKKQYNIATNQNEIVPEHKYIKENYKQVKLSMPNEEAQALDDYCKIKECSKAGFIRQAIKEKMEREP